MRHTAPSNLHNTLKLKHFNFACKHYRSLARCVTNRPSATGLRRPLPRYHEGNVPGVYVSYPFCAQKCTYCNFASGVFPAEMEPRYLKALQREIASHAWEWQPETVYLGGGTPSNLHPDALRALLGLIPGRPWAEATMEAAP